MKKKLQRVLAGCVAVGLCMSMISVTALADDGFDVSDESSTNEIQMAVTMLSSVASTNEDATGSDGAESSTVENSDGSTTTTTTEDTTITVGEDEYSASQTTEETKQTTEEKNEDGNTETTTTTNSSWEITESSDSSGVEIEGSGSENTEITDVTAPDGDAVSQTGSISGESGTTITVTESTTTGEPTTGVEENLEISDTTVYDSETDEPTVNLNVTPDNPSDTQVGYLKVDVEKYVDAAKQSEGTYYVYDTETGDLISSTEITVDKLSDDDGNLVGYTKTETVTTPGNVETVIPDIPESSTVVDEDTGYTTAITVTEVKDESTGEVIGYTAVTSVSDATGFVISERTETVTGEKTTSESAVTTTVTTRVYDLEALVTFTVTMGEVMDNSTSSMSSLLNPIAAAHDKKTDTSTDLYGRPNRSNYPDESYTKIDGYDYAWLGEYGLESAIKVNVGQNELAHQFVIVSTKEGSNEKYYVYCADLSTDAQTGYSYKIVNLEDSDYYNDEAAAHIRAIASVGYWGTESGTGSLLQLKETLYEAINAGETTLTREQVDQITEGMALTATQAAIWTYGNNGTKLAVNENNIVAVYNQNGNDKAVDTEKAKITQALYEYLVSLTEDPVGKDTLINENSITSASITVNSVATNDNGEIIMKGDDIVYDTDVSFILAVKPDEDSSELTVEIIDTETGDVLETRVITGSTDENEAIEYEVQEDGSVIYTIKGVTLADGTNIDIQLTGTQEMTGVYLFTSEDKNGTLSQTFVGLAEGEQTVDLSVGLTFKATDPTADYTDTETTTELKVIDITEWWSDEWAEENFEKPDEPDEPEIPEIPVVPVTPDTPAQPEAPATGTTEAATQPETTTEAAETADSQPASEAVISDVPKTGDDSNVAIYLVMAALSGAALIGLGVTGRKKNEEV